MNAALIGFFIEHPSLISGHIAKALPDAALAYGLVWIVIRPIDRSTFNNSILGHLCGIAVTAVGSVIFSILASATFAGNSAYNPALGSGGYFFYMLIVPAIVAAAYIQLLKIKPLPRIATPAWESTTKQKNDNSVQNFLYMTNSVTDTQTQPHFKMRTYKCLYCKSTFSDADKLWDIAIETGRCPKCYQALDNTPASVKEHNNTAATDFPRHDDIANTLSESRARACNFCPNCGTKALSPAKYFHSCGHQLQL